MHLGYAPVVVPNHADQDDALATHKAYQSLFLEFIEGTYPYTNNDYGVAIETMVEQQGRRLILHLEDWVAFDMEQYRRIITRPTDYLSAFDAALTQVAERCGRLVGEKTELMNEHTTPIEYHVGFDASTLVPHTPRTLRASALQSLVLVEGIATKISLARPILTRAVQYCQDTGAFHTRVLDESHALESRGPSALPTTDPEGRPLVLEYGLSTFRDIQTLTLQEAPESAPSGAMPQAICVKLESDLVDAVRPGERVRIVGVFKTSAPPASAHSSSSFISGVYRTALQALHVEAVSTAFSTERNAITPDDIARIKAIAATPNLISALGDALSPAICGMRFEKQAIILQLVGGRARIPTDGCGLRIRGDINVLLVGDPGTGKSQLLRATLAVAPLGVGTSGRSASGVGLTAAVVHDRESGDRRLEAGAMVLADRGIVCIDEFDKVSPEDRIAIHEAMEQQTVTVSKAGIQASLHARCAVLAAGNPPSGKYNRKRSVVANIGLPESLVSRFDLVFVVLDDPARRTDAQIAEHVISIRKRDDVEGRRTSEMAPTASTNNPSIGGLSLTKYLAYVKSRPYPEITEAAQMHLVETYETWRQRSNLHTVAITVRTLEAATRLAVAHAALRLGDEVEIEDARVATALLHHTIYQADMSDAMEEGIPQAAPAREAGHQAESAQALEGVQGPPLGSALREKVLAAIQKGFEEGDQVPLDQIVVEAERGLVLEIVRGLEEEGHIMLLGEETIIKI